MTEPAAAASAASAQAASSGSKAQPPDPKVLSAKLADDKLGELRRCDVGQAARSHPSITDIKSRLGIALEIKDLNEVYQANDYPAFLKAFLPAVMTTLGNVACSFHTDAPEQVSIAA